MAYVVASQTHQIKLVTAVTYTLTVLVKDRITGKPVSEASVAVNTTEQKTDLEGYATFPPLSEGTYKLKVTKSGYMSASASIDLKEDTEVTVALIPIWAIALGLVGAAVAGTVVIAAVKKKEGTKV